MTGDLVESLARLRRGLREPPVADLPVTVVCVARHGYATTRVSLENLYARTPTPFAVIYLDINSPTVVREYLTGQSNVREHFFHVRIDEYMSRQSARLLVLDMITTRYTVFVDNNMLFTEGWLENLVRTSENDDSPIVSPLITMHGGRVHFSGSRIESLGDGHCRRTQTTAKAPMTARLEDSKVEKMEIDFAESHCCLMRTDCFRGRAAEYFLEEMHNCHTLAIATQLMRARQGCRMLIEPESVVSILPIGAGYDIPWLFDCYNNLEMYKASYARHESITGKARSTTLANLHWHRKHLLYLLWTMSGKGQLAREDMLRQEEIPDEVVGYDKTLPDDILYTIRKSVLPFVEANYPRQRRALETWMYEINELVESIDSKIDEPDDAPRLLKRLGVSIVVCTYNGANTLPATLESIGALENESGRDWELIVVDNASTDDTARVAEICCPPGIRDKLTVVSEPRLGVAFARLKGFYSAKHEIISFIDDDNRPSADWLDAVGGVMEARPDVGVIGTYAEPVFEAEPPPWFEAVKKQYAVGSQCNDVGDITWRRGYVWGAGSSYRSQALKDVIELYGEPTITGRRGFRILTSGEDNESCYRLRTAGWKIWYDPSITIQHYIPGRKLRWSYLCRLNKGFGTTRIHLAGYKNNMRSDMDPKWRVSWRHALRWEVLNLWHSKRQVLRILVGSSEGAPSVLPVYRTLGRIMELLRLRQRYDERVRTGSRLVSGCSRPGERESVGQNGVESGVRT